MTGLTLREISTSPSQTTFRFRNDFSRRYAHCSAKPYQNLHRWGLLVKLQKAHVLARYSRLKSQPLLSQARCQSCFSQFFAQHKWREGT